MSWKDYADQNNDMIDSFKQRNIITTKEVEEAFRCVNRAAFVSKDLLDDAFIDAPIRGSPHIHMSAPHIYATILEELELETGLSFLNIGSGTGYFSCLVGYILKHPGINHGVELHQDLIDFAQERTLDFMANGPVGGSEICPPLFITGNCFQLDPEQLKYDRLYCGGACSQSTITFFLEFLKVGGFLIAPVGLKLVKLERVSHKEGVRTVISDVCFAPLTRLNPEELMKLRHGSLPLLRFPIKTKKQKLKKMIFAKTNFPVSSSPARRKTARLRAIQHVLDCLEEDGSIPLPLCYVAQIDQINAYKQHQKSVEGQSTSTYKDTPAVAEEKDKLVNNNQAMSNPFMTVQEFLLAASPPSVFYEFFGTSTQTESQDSAREMEMFLGPRLSRNNPRTRTIREQINENQFNTPPFNRTRTSSTYPIHNITVIDKSNTDFELGDKISTNIWEHLCSDKLWESVVDYYYSVSSTDMTRRNECLQLKGIEIVSPTVTKLADVLFYKMQKKKKKKERITFENVQNFVKKVPSDMIGSDIDQNNLVNLKKLSAQTNDQHFPSDTGNVSCHDTSLVEDIMFVVNSLVDQVCLQSASFDSQTLLNTSNESVDSILSIPSLNCTDESISSTSPEKLSSSTPFKVSRKKKLKYIDIQTDYTTSEKLSTVSQGWTIDHDVELISFLVSNGKETDHLKTRDNIPKVINEELFEKSKLSKYPLISSCPAQNLSYRSISLIRSAKLLDLVLEMLVGPSLQRDQFDNPFQVRRPFAASFSSSSFECSDSQLNVLEARNLTERKKSSPTEDSHEGEEEIIFQDATSPQDAELLKEVDSMILYEMNNVKHQQKILVRKLELIDNIDEQYKEQVKLLNQQVDLIEEQQRLLYEVNIDAGFNPLLASQLTSSQQIVTERKQQRQALIVKRDKINADRTLQLAERKQLLSMLEQLLSLETRLKNELTSLERRGMGYLRSHGNSISNFSQFVRKAEKILSRLKTTNIKMTGEMDEKENEEEESSSPKELKIATRRYNPQTILPRCRFLLPLSKKRSCFIKEMLRATERSAPRHMPIINIDRRIPVCERCKYDLESTVFIQIYQSLRNKDLHYRWNKKSYEQWWEVKFSGEGIIDQGGGFRDSLAELSEELCPVEPGIEPCLPLFIKTANQQSGIGECLECYTLNPSCEKFHLYRWLGQLMGACMRTEESLPISLPPFIWKLLVAEHVSWKRDFIYVDETAVRNVDGLENLDEDAYTGLNIEQTYTTYLTDGTSVDLIENGSNIVVKSCDRSSYSRLVRESRMMECRKQVKAVRDGLLTVVPEAVLSCLTWQNLMKSVCGDPCISVDDLKANCRYGDDLKPTSQCVLHMWTALSSFTDDERSRFLRFVTGRKRLPSPFIVSRSSVDKDNLPSASTCGSNLFLPEYSSVQVAKEKLRYAIYHCVAIDTDTSPW